MDDGGDRRKRGWGIGPNGAVVLRLSRRQLILMSALIAGGPVVGNAIASVGWAIAHGGWSEKAISLAFSLLWALVFVPIIYLIFREQRCTVTPDGISSSNGFRSTGIWWADVVAIEERTVFGGRMIVVVARHRTMHLGAPSSGPGRLFADPDFEAKLATIRAWQLSCTPAAAPPMVYPPPVLPWLPPPPI